MCPSRTPSRLSFGPRPVESPKMGRSRPPDLPLPARGRLNSRPRIPPTGRLGSPQNGSIPSGPAPLQSLVKAQVPAAIETVAELLGGQACAGAQELEAPRADDRDHERVSRPASRPPGGPAGLRHGPDSGPRRDLTEQDPTARIHHIGECCDHSRTANRDRAPARSSGNARSPCRVPLWGGLVQRRPGP